MLRHEWCSNYLLIIVAFRRLVDMLCDALRATDVSVLLYVYVPLFSKPGQETGPDINPFLDIKLTYMGWEMKDVPQPYDASPGSWVSSVTTHPLPLSSCTRFARSV